MQVPQAVNDAHWGMRPLIKHLFERQLCSPRKLLIQVALRPGRTPCSTQDVRSVLLQEHVMCRTSGVKLALTHAMEAYTLSLVNSEGPAAHLD